MLSVSNGLVVVGCVCVGFIASAGPGLVARAAEPQSWVESLSATQESPSVSGDAAAQRRIAELEQRLKELEAERRGAAPEGPTPGQGPSVLATVAARNHEVMARPHALSIEDEPLAQSRAFERPVAASVACRPAPGGADPKAQLRYWAERLRNGDSGFRGGLTPEQNAALNVLLRRERALDPHNPWHEP